MDEVPPIVNDAKLIEHVRKVAIDVVGEKNLVPMKPIMGSEDFSFYTQNIPGAFYFLGMHNDTCGAVHSGHSPLFFIDEDVLLVGATMHTFIALSYIQNAQWRQRRYIHEEQHHHKK